MASTLFTTRNGGISLPPYATNNLASHVGDGAEAVRENRTRLTQKVGPVLFMNQTHGNSVVVVDGFSTHEPNADALITQESGVALAALVADCIPLLLWDEDGDCIAAVHVGRRGLVNGITAKVIELMMNMGAQDIRGVIGPCICSNCYEVGQDVFDEVCDSHPVAQSKTKNGSLSLDLPGALTADLVNFGVEVSSLKICTVEDPNYFSYRRDGITGRQAGVIWK